MYGSDPYASVPYAAMGGFQLLVAACIHVSSQLVYNLGIGVSNVYYVAAGKQLVYSASISTYIC
jgi:hypothetical protein